MPSVVRLYVDSPLAGGQAVPLTQEAHYLANVMRRSIGDPVVVFNGQDGEWRCEIEALSKRNGVLRCVEQTRPQTDPPDLWLLFAPIKKARTDFIVEKAVELGVARICPVQTDHTNSERIKIDRLQAHAVEAAEQCETLVVPKVMPLTKLGAVLDGWQDSRSLWFADEALAGQPHQPTGAGARSAAILIGPEGGFSQAERQRLRSLPFAQPIALGPRILRADTAAVAALTLWQAKFGDWS